MSDVEDTEPDNPTCAAMGHEQETTYEDDEVWQGRCTRCGAELWEDRT